MTNMVAGNETTAAAVHAATGDTDVIIGGVFDGASVDVTKTLGASVAVVAQVKGSDSFLVRASTGTSISFKVVGGGPATSINIEAN